MIRGIRFSLLKRPFSLLVALCILLLTYCSSLRSQADKENADFKLAVNLYNDGLYDLALQQFNNFIEAYPGTANSIEARFFIGLTQMQMKHFDDARMTFQSFALTYSNHQKAAEAWMKAAEAFLALGNEREAASTYERIKVFHPKSPLVPQALFKAGTLYQHSGDRNNAKRLLRSVLQDYPTHSVVPMARLKLSEIYAEEDQPHLAEQEARRVSESNAPDSIQANALMFLGILNMHSSLFDAAEEKFQTVLTRYPKTPAALEAAYHRGILLQSAGKYSEAIAQFQKILVNEPYDSLKLLALLATGDAYIALQNHSAALKYFDEIVTKYPTSPFIAQALYKSGNAAFAQKNYPVATTYYEKLAALTTSPLQYKALIRLAEIATATKRYNEAASWYLEFLNRSTDDHNTPEVFYQLALLYRDKLNDCSKAISILDDINQKFPRSAIADDALLARAKCLENLNNYEQALQAYKNILTFYPANTENTTILQRIIFLQNHKNKNFEGALEQLARLVGEALVQNSKAEIAFQLAQVYFHNLKNYAAAAVQYGNAIGAGLDEKKLATAYFYRARAFHLLSEVEPEAAEEAQNHYALFLKQFPAHSLSNEAAYYNFQLKQQSYNRTTLLNEAKTLLQKDYPPEIRQDLLFFIGKESNDLMKIQYFQQLEQEFPQAILTQEALWLLGKWYRNLQKSDSAMLLWEKAVNNIPNGFFTSKILEQLAELYLQTNQYNKAIAAYEKLITEYCYTHEAEKANEHLVDILFAAGKYSEAIDRLEQEINTDKTSIFDSDFPWNKLKKLATFYEKLGNTKKASRLYNQYLLHNRLSADANEVYYALGVIARTEGRSGAAASYFKQAAAVSASGVTSKEIADLLFQNEQYDESARQYKRLALSSGTKSDQQYFLSRAIVATLRLNKLPEAQTLIADFKKEFGRIKTAEAEFAFEMGTLYYRNKNYTQAKKVFEDLTDDYEKSPFEPWGYYYLGKIAEVTNNLEQAAKQYINILEKFSNSDVVPRTLLSLGNMHFNAERYDDAIRYYVQIIDRADKAGDVLKYAMSNLIEAYESKKMYDGALKLTRDYIERYPNDEDLIDKKIKIGILYTKIGYYDQAILHFQNLLSEAGSLLEAELRYNIGEAYYYKGDYQQAILEFLKVPYLTFSQGKVNWTATSLYMAGQSYEKMSKFNEALQMYQQIIDRSGIDATFKAAARKEIDRIRTIIKKGSQ